MKSPFFIVFSAFLFFSCAKSNKLPSQEHVLENAFHKLDNWETLSFSATTSFINSKKSELSTVYKLKKVPYEPHLKLFFFKEMNGETAIYYKLASLNVVEDHKKKVTAFDYGKDRSIPKYLDAYMGDDDSLWKLIRDLHQFKKEISFSGKDDSGAVPAYIYTFTNKKLWLDSKGVPLKLVIETEDSLKKQVLFNNITFDAPLEEADFTPDVPADYVTTVFGIKKEPMLNIPAPDWDLIDVKGNKVSLNDFKGKPLFIEAWVSSCSHCMASLPNIKKIHKDFANKVKVVTVNFDYDIEETLATIKSNQIEYPVLLGDAIFDQNYDLRSFPSYFVIDSSGKIIYSERGTIEGKKEKALFEALGRVN